MIICYAGLPGAGKSYSAVENVVIPALKEKRHVAHNLQLVPEALSEACGYNVTEYLHQIPAEAEPDEVIQACPPGAVIVIDEIWEYWGAGLKVSNIPKDQLRFFKKHRHRVGDDGIASEMVIIDQDPQTSVPAFIRALIDQTYLHTKLDDVGMSDRFRVDIYDRAQSAEKPNSKKILRSLYGTYKPEVYRCYVSHTQSTIADQPGLEKAPDQRGNVLKSFTVKAAIGALIVMPFLFYTAFQSFMNLGNLGKEPEPVAKTDTPTMTIPPRELHPQPDDWDAIPKQNPIPAMHTATPAPTPNPHVITPDPAMVAKVPQTSRRWRLIGISFKPETGEGLAYLATVGGYRKIDRKHCEVDSAGDWRCAVEDGFATFYSATFSDNPFSAKRAPGAADNNLPMRDQSGLVE